MKFNQFFFSSELAHFIQQTPFYFVQIRGIFFSSVTQKSTTFTSLYLCIFHQNICLKYGRWRKKKIGIKKSKPEYKTSREFAFFTFHSVFEKKGEENNELKNKPHKFT